MLHYIELVCAEVKAMASRARTIIGKRLARLLGSCLGPPSRVGVVGHLTAANTDEILGG
jgi:hypothetical protein